MLIETTKSALLKTFFWVTLATIASGYSAFVFIADWQQALKIAGLSFVLFFGLIIALNPVLQKIPLGKRRVRPLVLWFTGLPASGKTSLAKRLLQELRDRGFRTQHLDGDQIRQIFPDTGFDPEGRKAHIERVAYAASLLQKAGTSVVCSFISPYQSSREFARGLCDSFFEIHVATPQKICEQRDPKGLYAKARRGEIDKLTGVSDPYEEPKNPELRVDTSQEDLEETVDRILKALKEKRLL